MNYTSSNWTWLNDTGVNSTSSVNEQPNPDGSSDESLALLGDVLCMSGAALYGLSNVGQEYTVKRHSVVEYLGMLGLFGAAINGVQLAVLEFSVWATVPWGDVLKVLLPLGGFAAAMFSLSLVFAFVVRRSSAAVVNLNVLTADLYALLCGVLLFHYSLHYLYAIAFVLILVGVILFLIREPTFSERRAARFERFVVRLERLLCLSDSETVALDPSNSRNYAAAVSG